MNFSKKQNAFQLSPIVHGHWRLNEWHYSAQKLLALTQQLIELGVTSFDHADIYGDYTCENLFGKAIKLKPAIRQNIQIVSKCGIKLMSDKYPDRKIKYYDYNRDHILHSAENSLKNLHTDYLDLLLLHRPSPFFNPEEVAAAFSELKRSGKVRHFGVSNFNPAQFDMLESFTDEKLVTNQVEISPAHLEHFENGNIDFFLKNKIRPMAWSPVAGGRLFHGRDDKYKRIRDCVKTIAKKENTSPTKIIYAWLFNHPARIIPIVGSGKLSRIKAAVEAQVINLSVEDWLRIYNASQGKDLP
ncbi:MAG: aldo/keto reductase [Bacteroidota bacterium]|nr:aldo/keto reductase [Bacteroidota bacterium]